MVPDASDWIPRVPSYSGSHSGRLQFRVRGLHPLRRTFQCPSSIFRESLLCGPSTPTLRSVWAPPSSLAATKGIILIFFSSRYEDVSIPWVLSSHTIYSCVGSAAFPALGFPIRISTDLCVRTTPRRVSPFAASFFCSPCLGIHHTPLFL